MKKLLLLFLSLSGWTYSASAQDDITLLYSNHFQLNASQLMPSMLGNDKSKMQLSIGYFNFWLGNNRVAFGSMRSQQNTNGILDEVERALKKENRFGTGQDLQYAAFSIKAMKNEKERVTVGFGITDQLSLDLTISASLFKLLWNGNKQFAGQKVELGPLRFNAQYNRHYFLAMAIPYSRSDRLKGRVGFRLKYIEGISNIYMPHTAGGTVFTEQDGKYIEVDGNFETFTSGISRDFSPFAFNGHGFGVDVGTSLLWSLKKIQFQVSASALDIGRIYFQRNTRQIISNQFIEYSGQVIDGFFGDDYNFGTDSLSEILEAEVNEDVKYNTPLSTRFIVQLEMKAPGIFGRNRDNKEGNGFFITYVQGLRNFTKSTTVPYVSIGYRYSLLNVWNLGGSVGYGGFNKFTIGLFTSIGVKYFRIGVGSTNLAGIIYRKKGTGVNLSFNLMFGF